MTRRDQAAGSSPVALAAGFELFGPPPLLAGEDRGAYEQLLARVAADIDPRNTLEMMWVRDIVDLVWETLRYRRFRALIVDAAREEALRFMLGIFFMADRSAESRPQGSNGSDDAHPSDGSVGGTARLATRLAAGWWNDPQAKAEVSRILGEHQIGEETIAAEAYRRRGEDLERIEKMLISAEIRRNTVVKEIAAYRESLAERARTSAARMIDGEAVEVRPARLVAG